MAKTNLTPSTSTSQRSPTWSAERTGAWIFCILVCGMTVACRDAAEERVAVPQESEEVVVEAASPAIGPDRSLVESVWLETGGEFTQLLAAGRTVPCKASQVLTTYSYSDNQRQIAIALHRGRAASGDIHLLGRFWIRLPWEARGAPQIEVQMVAMQRDLRILVRDRSSEAALPVDRAPIPECPPSSDPDHWFQEGTFWDEDAFTRGWYSRHLSKMQEPSLSCGPHEDRETYRFTWIRSFHHPIAVRITWSLDRGELVAFEMDGMADRSGDVLRAVHRNVERAEWESIRAGIEHLRFWIMPTRSDDFGCDGAQWIVEGRRGDAYHVVDRWTPRSGEYRDLGLLFLHIAGITVPADEIY